MRQLLRFGPAVLIVVALTVLPVGPAQADDGLGGADCSTPPRPPECDVFAESPGQPAGGATDNTSGGNGDGNGDGGSGDGSGGETSACRYERVEPQRPPPPGVSADGAWYTRICPVAGGGSAQSQAMWVAGAAPAVVDPAVLAVRARRSLRLSEPSIRLNPAPPAAQLVHLPTWLWLPRQQWQPVTATASVPGLSVTATATPVRVAWLTGDGVIRVCDGAGSAWAAGMDPKRASPTCGHTYTSTSAGRPSGTFELRATVTWQVTWAGGGDGGTLDPLTTTSAVAVRVVQSTTYNRAG